MKIPSIFPFPPSSHISGAPDRDRGPQVRLFAISLVLAAASAVLGACARMVPGFAHTYYITIYPVPANTIGRFSSIFPFSLSEAGLYLAAVFCILNLLFLIKKPLAALSRLFFLACLLLFLYTAGCGINYYRTPFSYEAGMVMEQSSAGELYSLCLFLTEQINSTLTETDHSVDALKGLYPGQTEDTPLPSAAMLRELGMEGVKSMKGLGTAYPQLSGYYPYPKPLMNPRLLSIQQLCGIYSPFTIEANYNREMPYYNIPHTICHELSHLKGFMREDEANFIGYLACIGSDSPDFRYSGYLTGWVYAGNALAKADLEAYYGLYGRLAPEAARDLAWNNQFWDRFDGKVAEASTQLNDRYLKANNQEDGVRSYGRMVDLMLAYYRDSQ